MPRIVQKYGGSSVANPDLIRQVAKKAIAAKKDGNEVVVVLSAMKGETDRLLRLARDLYPNPSARELDSLLSTGEQASVTLFAIACQALGERVKSFLGFQAGIQTDDTHQSARILDFRPDRILTELAKGRVAVVAGFQGINRAGDITTLGRGGSDTTAVALAIALGADVCEIYSDVDGIYTTDPNVYEKARKLDWISYEEMLELSSLGAKVMEIRSVELGMAHDLKIHVRHAHGPGTGTIICKEEPGMERTQVRGVTHQTNEARITLIRVKDEPGVAARILGLVAQANIIVDMIIQNLSKTPEDGNGYTDLSFTVPLSDYARAMDLMNEAKERLGNPKIVGDDGIAKVSVVGLGMRNHSGVASTMFQALANQGINIEMIATSEIKISCVIDKKKAELAVRAIHDAFHLDLPPGKGKP
jgi:aspartate kinase